MRIYLLALLLVLPAAGAQELPDLPVLPEPSPGPETPEDIMAGDGASKQPGEDPAAPGFEESVRDGVSDSMMMLSIAGIGAALLGGVGFALVSRRMSPKEALKNPQRAMVYGYIRAQPGAHLKQLSDEFKMKSSSILWHIRKLEGADLVKSDRANGFRVFYAVEGGMEFKRVSRAVTVLRNENAKNIFHILDANPGLSVAQISNKTGIHQGTIRWHLRKLRDFGTVEELTTERASQYYVTPLGRRSMETMEGKPVDGVVNPAGYVAEMDSVKAES